MSSKEDIFVNGPAVTHEGKRDGDSSDWLLDSDLKESANWEGKVGRGIGLRGK